MSNISKNIKQLRKHFGMSQEELGQILNRHKSAIRWYKSSKRISYNENLQMIREYFDNLLDTLMHGEVCYSDYASFSLSIKN